MLPILTRRHLLRFGSLTIGGGFLCPFKQKLGAASGERIQPRGSADVVIFINLVGSPAQMDTFDAKELKSSPADLDIRKTPFGFLWPYGLLPKTAEVLGDVVVMRSMSAWETLHNLAQYYLQVGHQFNAARAAEMPCIGSVIAYETLKTRKESDFLPPFVSMNFPTSSVNGGLLREGALESSYAPLAMDVGRNASLPFRLADEQRERFHRRLDLLSQLDSQRSGTSAPGRYREWDSFVKSARRMIESPEMSKLLELSVGDRARYGDSPLGDACLVARNMLQANAGAKYFLINYGGWDHHADIYGKKNTSKMESPGDRGGIYLKCRELDRAYQSLLMDLKSAKDQDGRGSLLDRTLVLCMGEFGRTPGDLNDAKGRDHWPNVRAGLAAGGGIRHGGRVIGATDERAGEVKEFEWHMKRAIYPEDVTATIYSALGIDWTKKIGGLPSGRDFEYVESMSGTSFIGSTEVKELFA